jgi:anti-anti-sigma regulatory factor
VSRKKTPRKPKQPRAEGPAAAPACVELAAQICIVQAADLHRLLVSRLAAAQPIEIDGSRVEEIDTAILQLLASLWRTAGDRGVACSWRGVSESLRYAANLIGVAGVLALPPNDAVQDVRDAAA